MARSPSRPRRLLLLQAAIHCLLAASFGSSLFGQSIASVTLAWDRNLDIQVAGYNIYCGVASRNYTNAISLGDVTNTTVTGLAPTTTYYFAVTAVDARGLESEFSNEISYSVPAALDPGNPSSPPGPTNTPPNISILADQTINVGTAAGPLSFTLGDAETPAAELTVFANSSNPALVPNTNISLGGSGTNRTVIVTPAAGQVGTSSIALTVCDPSLCATASFLLTVNPLPTVKLSSPAGGATFSAPALINLGAGVSPNNHSINKVRFFSGAALVGEAAVAPYTFNWNNVQAGSYSLTAQAVYDAGSTVASLPATVTVLGLCPPWQTADIGSTPTSGTAAISDAVYTVQGAGNIGASTDNFRFLYQPLSGDGEILLQITSVQNTGNNGCIGAMIRESLASKSRYAFMGISPSGAFRWQCRNKTGAGTSTTKAGAGTPPSTWSRLVRSGNTLSGYKSTDGAKWTLVSSSTISMAPNIWVGIAVASGCTNLTTSVFNNVTVVP